MDLREEITEQISASLQLNAEEISSQSNLIEYGLHSLTIIELVDFFERKYNRQLSYADFAMSPSIDDWVNLLGQSEEGRPPLEPERGRGNAENRNAAVELPRQAPLSDMQYAYWAGRQSGDTAAHLYVEFSGRGIDVARLQTAFARLLDRHSMLAVAITPDGYQQIGRDYRAGISIDDLGSAEWRQAAAFLKQKRQRMSHQKLDVGQGQVIDVSLTLLPGGNHRLHIDMDMIAVDAASYLLVVEDLGRLYQDAGYLAGARREIDYFDYLRRLEDDWKYQNAVLVDQQWWQERLELIAEPPELPLLAEGLRVDPNRFDTLCQQFSASDKAALGRIAERYRITPASLLLTLFSLTVASWSRSKRFRLNLPLFQRRDVGAEVSGIVGDFSNFVLLDVALEADEPLALACQRIHREWLDVSQHAACAGIQVLRDLSRLRRQTEIAPVVFTSSALERGELFSELVDDTLGKPVWCLSQGPKVDLDVQVAHLNGGFLVNWDIRLGAFRGRSAFDMFAHYIAAIRAVIDEPGHLERPVAKQPSGATGRNRHHPTRSIRDGMGGGPGAHLPNGLPLANGLCRLVNELGQDCPDWVMGELWIGGDGLPDGGLGAHGGPGALVEYDNRVWYKTGWLAYRNDRAEVVLYAPVDQPIKYHGYFVEVEAIAALILSIAGVGQARVCSIRQKDTAVLAALVVPETALGAVSEERIRRILEEKLPRYLVPRHYQFAERLPLTVDGLVDLQGIKERLQAGASEAVSRRTGTALEQATAYIFAKVVGIDAGDVSLEDDFFDQGGDSLLATHLVAALNQYFKGCQLTVVDIFVQRTPKDIARSIEERIPRLAQSIAEVFLKVVGGRDE